MDEFPTARHGYQRSSVDRFTADARNRLDALARANTTLTNENRRLADLLAELQSRYDRLETAGLVGRGQDIVAAAEAEATHLRAEAERDAAEIARQAQLRAEVVDERARQELAWGRRQLRQERAELTQQQQAMREQLRSFRDLAVDTAQQEPGPPELSFADVADAPVPTRAEQHA